MADEVKTTEEVVKTDNGNSTPQPEVVVSGLARQIEKYKTGGMKMETPPKPTNGEQSSATDKKFDYSFFKDLKEDDYKKYESVKDEETRYNLLSLTNDMKKNQRLVSEREKTINELKNTKPEERYAKMEEFMSGMKQDALGTYKRFQKDFDLPDIEFLEKQVSSGGDIQSRLEQWQESDLLPKIEKKFKIESGTFVYDPSEAYKAGTPSYEYRVQTDKQERAWSSEYETTQTKQQEILGKIKQQNDADLLFVKETYFPESEFESKEKAEEAFVTALNKLDEIQSRNQKGEFDPLANPFAFRNIFRGVMFDELVAKTVDKAVNDLHSQYNAKGLYLPGSEQPTNVTTVKGVAPATSASDEQKRKFSPMHRSIRYSTTQ